MTADGNKSVVQITEDGAVESSVDVEMNMKQPQVQKRMMTWLFSKRVPPIPSEEDVGHFPADGKRNFISYLFFWYMMPLFKTGYIRTVENVDLWKIRPHDTIEKRLSEFDAAFNKYLANWRAKNPDADPEKWPLWILPRALASPLKFKCILAVALCAVNDAATISTTVVINRLIKFVESRAADRSVPVARGIELSLAVFLLTAAVNFAVNHMVNMALQVGISCKSVLMRKAFDKAINLSAEGRDKYPASKITSIIGNDLSRLEFAFSFIVFIAPLTLGLIAVVVMLIVTLGVPALPGIGVLVVTTALQAYLSNKLFMFRGEANGFTDSRVAQIRELLNNFKIIKFYNWETPFFGNFKDIRSKEMRIVLKMKFFRCALEAASFSLPIISTMVSFVVYYKLKGVSDVASIFTSLSLFQILASQVSMAPSAFSTVADALYSLRRVRDLLQAPNAAPITIECDEKSEFAIEIKDASFEWESFGNESAEEEAKSIEERQTQEGYELQSMISSSRRSIVSIESVMQKNFDGFHSIDISIKRGEFVIITGLIGSGKTSLLNAIAGNLLRTQGSLSVNDSALLCDTPWVQNASIKENIVFGSAYDSEKYEKVLSACSLLDDLKLFEHGDATEVGERGITLSGGQKARINLARAVYADVNIMLMDDVLSAVDAKVGQNIMKECFLGMLAQKTRVLATHQLSLIGVADRVIFLNKDGTVEIGEPDKLKSANAEFARLLSFNSEMAQVTAKSEEEELPKEDKFSTNAAVAKDEEIRAVNSLGWNIYKAFFFAGEGAERFVPMFSFVITLLITNFGQQFINVWLSFWSENRYESVSNGAYLGIYIMLNLVTSITTLATVICLGIVVNNASLHLIIDAARKLLHAPMSFIDTTPLGRVLNRFTKDTDVLDNEIFQSLLVFFSQMMSLIGSVILTIAYLPWLCIAIPVIMLVCFAIANFTQSTTREVKRLEATRRSFVFNNINETLSGLATIKAYGAENRFIQRANDTINGANTATIITLAGQRWLSLYLGLCATAYIFLVSALAASGIFHTSPATTGLLLSALMAFADQIGQIFRSFLAVENSMNSAERLHQYSTDLVQEAPFEISETTPNPSWPVNPSIEFDHVSLSYRPELPLVLKDVSFKVEAREKIGICGRTGAGKSSVINALFRISEMKDGKITIDGLDISKLGLASLRSKLAIIPQETVMFKGTVRDNLDPFGALDDSVLLDVLEKTGLAGVDSEGKSKFQLDAVVEDDGANFSLGEKQLMALARALARDSNIIILDEATSSVDYKTDSQVQKTIRSQFDHCTILCIAHRLKTILDYDKILVLDGGEIKEFDTPLNLFNQEHSIFREMCEKSSITAGDFNSTAQTAT